MAKTLKTFVEEQRSFPMTDSLITEALITLGNKAFPKFGNVVILGGGAGSGKGFIKDKLLGIEGWVFDVDELKRMALKSDKIAKITKEEYGKELSQLSLGNPDDVFFIHSLISNELKLDSKKKESLFASVLISPSDRKPNLIFDVTLKDFQKFSNLTKFVSTLGYGKENIHIVWVLNDIKIALQQNSQRERKVPEEILKNTHVGVAQTMNDIFVMGNKLNEYMNGDIWVVPNKANVDTEVETSSLGGMWIKKAFIFKIKEAGKQMSVADISKELLRKIKSYTPSEPTLWS